jgi:hypothetical protein
VAWRAIEWDAMTPPWVAQDTIRDYYTLATKAFENYIANAGPAMVPELFKLKVEFMEEGMKAPDRFSRMLVNITDTIAVDRIFGEGDLRPGPAVITVFINGSVLQTRRLQISEEGQ